MAGLVEELDGLLVTWEECAAKLRAAIEESDSDTVHLKVGAMNALLSTRARIVELKARISGVLGSTKSITAADVEKLRKTMVEKK